MLPRTFCQLCPCCPHSRTAIDKVNFAACRNTESRVAARAGEAADRRVWRREQKEALDDLLPKPTGGTHEARVRGGASCKQQHTCNKAVV
jgi:hypothetical protein